MFTLLFYLDDLINFSHYPFLIDSSTELELFLHENDDAEKANVDEKWGKVVISVKLNPKSQEEKEHVSLTIQGLII